MRSPALDVALRMPGFRRRMARRLAPDEWLYPNLNTGCVVKMAPDGTVLESLWDLDGEESSDDHVHARAQGLSLSRRHLQQPHRPLPDSRAPTRTGTASRAIGRRRMDNVFSRSLDRFLGGATPRSPFRRWTARSNPTAPSTKPSISSAEIARTICSLRRTAYCSLQIGNFCASAPIVSVTSIAQCEGEILATALAADGSVAIFDAGARSVAAERSKLFEVRISTCRACRSLR